MKVGRPTKYKEEYCDQIIEYFTVEPQKTLYKKEYFQDGTLKSEVPIVMPEQFPTFQGFANEIGVDVDTMLNWGKEHPEFFGAYARAKALQEKIWLINSMGNLYNSQFAQFFGKNCLGYKDKTETEITGKDGGPIQYEEMTPEERAKRIAELLNK